MGNRILKSWRPAIRPPEAHANPRREGARSKVQYSQDPDDSQSKRALCDTDLLECHYWLITPDCSGEPMNRRMAKKESELHLKATLPSCGSSILVLFMMSFVNWYVFYLFVVEVCSFLLYIMLNGEFRSLCTKKKNKKNTHLGFSYASFNIFGLISAAVDFILCFDTLAVSSNYFTDDMIRFFFFCWTLNSSIPLSVVPSGKSF